MASTPFEDDETTNTQVDQGSGLDSTALGADAEPTGMILGAEAEPTGVALGAEVAPTTVEPWPATSSPLPKDYESTSVVPWADAPPPQLNNGPTAPGIPPAMNPALHPRPAPSSAPGFIALGTDSDPEQTHVEVQVAPLLIKRPRVSVRHRMARRLSAPLRLPRGYSKQSLIFY